VVDTLGNNPVDKGESETSYPTTGLDRHFGLQKVRLPEFLDIRHKKVIRLSALRTGHVYSPADVAGAYSC
jgi:hypothetical protein